MFKRLALWAAIGFGVGRLPVAPGTWGTLVGAAYAWGLLHAPWQWRMALVLAGLAFAVWAAGLAARELGQPDPPSVVIDEIAAFPLATVAMWGTQGQPEGLLLFAAAFVFFRAADILKPPPARQVEKMRSGVGIVLDDIVAAVYAGIGTGILRWFVAG